MAESGSPPALNGRYLLVSRLGSGSFGEVWLAKDLVLDDMVAVKLLGRNVILDAAMLEAQILNRLRKHERVVTIRNIELQPPMPFIAMDYEPGGSVGDKLDVGDVSMVEGLRWTREALDGLAHTHDEGVLHRDVKPDNLLLDGNNRVVLSDFGIAEDTVRKLIVVRQSYVPHLAPEVIAGHPSSRSSDIFAMGCTLYRLLTGEYPFATPAETEAGSFTQVHRLNPQVPMVVSRIVTKALSLDPADRYEDAREMLGELTNCGVSRCWTRADEKGHLETWFADGPDGEYVLYLLETPRGKFRVGVTRDMGSRPRHVFKEDFDRRSDAVRERRNWLVRLAQS